MGFTNLGSSLAKTQADLVEEQTEAKPESMSENLSLPGLPLVLTMGESQLLDFFSMALRMRPNVHGVDFTLGDEYKYTESAARLPGANALHTKEIPEIAKVLMMCLASNPKAIGFKAELVVERDGSMSSKLFVRVGEKIAKGPEYNEDGDIVKLGDDEFAPRLTLTYKPV